MTDAAPDDPRREPDSAATTPGAGQAKSLSRDLSDFLIEFSIALNKHAMYPDGHPSLGPAVERVIDRLEPLFVERSSLSLGVARRQLVIEGVATDPGNAVLRDLAARLHRHQLGAMTFRRGVTPQELREALMLLAMEADRSERPLGLAPRDLLEQWPGVRLYPLTYDRLELVEEGTEGASAEPSSREQRTRAAQLWIGLARAAIAVESADGEQTTSPATDPADVAKAIESHERGSAYDQVIVGYMLQIADELRTGETRETGELKSRISRLIGTLDPDALKGLLEMGGDAAQRRRFLLHASEGMAVDAVVDLVRAASQSEQQQTVSHSLLRMLQKLSLHAETGRGRRRVEAESAVREQVSDLVRGWSLDDPNPEAYREALSRMAAAESVFAVSPDQRYAPESQRLIGMALEVNAMGGAVERAVEQMLDRGRYSAVLELLDSADEGDARSAIWQLLTRGERIRTLASQEPLDADVLDRLLAHAGAEAIEPLLDVLSDSESSQTRRALLDRLLQLGAEVAPSAVRRLPGAAWYVQRNLLRLLAELQVRPEGFQPDQYTRHDDPRVRLEAFRILIGDAQLRARAIARALGDQDERILQLATHAAISNCPAEAVPLLSARLAGGGSDDLRSLTARALGACDHPLAVRALLDVAAPKKGLLGSKPPPKSPVYLAALKALGRHASQPAVQAALAMARRSRDPEVRTAAGGS